MFLGKREIGIGCEPLVIAEIGINHRGSLDIAKWFMKLLNLVVNV